MTIVFAIVGGVIAIILGLVILGLGENSRASMEVSMGNFKGPAWFLLFITGILLIGFGLL